MNELTGKPVDRVDGKLKVTGAAKYSAEFDLKNLAHGAIVQSTIARGRISLIDTKTAEAQPGVLAVMTYKNSMSLHQLSAEGGGSPGSGKLGEKDLLPLQNERIFYDGQHIAVVIAETFEQAEHAAHLVRVEYQVEEPALEIEQQKEKAYKPEKGLGGTEVQVSRGDIVKGFADAATKIGETYSTPVYHHNPMEPHATIAEWNGDQLTIYDATQSVIGSRNAIAQMLGMLPDKVRLISYFLGGGFGCKGFTWAHSVLAPMAARQVGRPVKIVLNRMQMFTSNGRRSRTIQHVELGSGKEGKLTAILHASQVETSFVDEFIEPAGTATKLLYESPNVDVSHSIVRLNKGTPCPTRAPGEAPGTYAFEVALDELAVKLNMDPVQLRLANYAEKNPHDGHAWSSKYLRECYQRGAQAIGWSQRNPVPGAVKQGRYLVGYGMATAVYPGNRAAAAAKLRLYPDGRAVAACCTQDIGTGTYTILAQIAADALGLPIQQIEVKLGDTKLPKGPNSGGSQTAASAGPAVQEAALDAKSKLIKKALADKKSALFGQPEAAILVENGRLFVQNDPGKADTYTDILKRAGLPMMEGSADINVSTRETQGQEANPASKGSGGGGEEGKEQEGKADSNPFVKQDEEVDRKKYSFQSFGAQFVRVLVDADLGTVRVDKVASVMDIGKVLNLKTAENQVMGGAIFGIGMALMEQTVYDPNNGRVVTRDLADYLVPVNADMPSFTVEFINKPDPFISPIGARGVGEIGITGIAAAIANAVYNATGKRIRELPITPDKLL
ncbi:MAG: xanthine dehydrogenase family protein molybdopterin-binding subunit [Williamsia sp.]|nr:xanthine dehydrogenase family protein molybdopterin-binding subunit [Williamsia sp.]